MKTTTFSQFRNNARKFFDAVEKGETVQIYRKGKPVAVLSPLHKNDPSYWNGLDTLNVKGISLSDTLIQDRRKEK